MHARSMECIRMFLGEAAYPTICYINYECDSTTMKEKKGIVRQTGPLGNISLSMCAQSITCM